MEIVIEIDENVFTRLFDNGIKDYAIANDDLFAIAKSIRNCTPLPEHHGNLKDVDKMMARLCKDDCKQTNGECKFVTRCSFWDAVQEAETIIPATKGKIEPKNFWCTKKSQWCNHQNCNDIPSGFPRECDSEFKRQEMNIYEPKQTATKEKSCSNCLYYPNTAPCDSCEGYSNYNEQQRPHNERRRDGSCN